MNPTHIAAFKILPFLTFAILIILSLRIYLSCDSVPSGPGYLFLSIDLGFPGGASGK